MNPLTWPREHLAALFIAAAIGASLGLVLGYIVYASAQGADGALSFSYWTESPFRLGGFWWTLFGAAIGSGVVFVRRLTAS